MSNNVKRNKINLCIIEEVEKEKKLFANKSIWEASKFLKSSLGSSDNEQPINVKDQINAIKKLGGITRFEVFFMCLL